MGATGFGVCSSAMLVIFLLFGSSCCTGSTVSRDDLGEETSMLSRTVYSIRFQDSNDRTIASGLFVYRPDGYVGRVSMWGATEDQMQWLFHDDRFEGDQGDLDRIRSFFGVAGRARCTPWPDRGVVYVTLPGDIADSGVFFAFPIDGTGVPVRTEWFYTSDAGDQRLGEVSCAPIGRIPAGQH